MHHRAPAIVGAILGVATAAVYLIGANRSYGYDAAATFANFVATPSLWDAFAIHSVLPTVPIKSVASNDHVLLSLLSHAIYSITGSRGEIVYRLLPALAAGATVGVTSSVLNLRFGLVAGISGGLFIATDPLFVENSRDLRGYSLAALGAVLATLILAGRWTRWRLVAYALLIGLAVAAQFFAVVVLLIHIAWIVARGSWPQVHRLLPAWIVAAAIGVAANANIQVMELLQQATRRALSTRTFHATSSFSWWGRRSCCPSDSGCLPRDSGCGRCGPNAGSGRRSLSWRWSSACCGWASGRPSRIRASSSSWSLAGT